MSVLAGKTAVVTGPTSGIGAAVVQKLVSRGAQVVALARDAEKLAELEARSEGRVHGVVADLADEKARDAAVAEILARHPRIDVFVSNAAECVYASPLDFPVERLRRLFEVNLFAGLALLQAFIARMQKGAHVVHVSSVTARMLPNPKFGAYGITKTALDGLSEALRLELDPKGIKVTSIVPGLVDTPIYDKVEGFGRALAKIRETLPTWLSPDDVADSVLWALERPEHVSIAEIVILPRGQAR
jgi:NAD(P)-dependent dehydrogenase (short-subunit alcohol dehydrogenase family)